MQDSKAIKLLKQLNPDEFRRFYRFLKSPFFTTNVHIVKMYEYLRKYYPAFNSNKLQREKVFAKLFPQTPFNYEKLAALIKKMTNLVEDYMIWIDLKSQEADRQKRLSKIYAQRNLFAFYERSRLRQLERMDKQPYRDLEYYQNRYSLDFDYFFHPLTPKHTLQDDALIRLMDSVDQTFILGKYRIASEMKNRERILAKQYDIRFLEAIENEIRNGLSNKNISLQLYQLLLQMYVPEKEGTAFEKLKNLFSENAHRIRHLDQSLLLTQMINYTVKQINIGNAAFYQKALELYKIGLEIGLVVENQKIDAAVFGNIVLLGCNAREFEWTKHFMVQNQQYLKESIRQDTVALNMGLWYFHQNDFDKAYHKFFNHTFSYAFQLKARFYLIRTLLEQFLSDDTLLDLLISQIDAFEKFLYRNKMISSYHKKTHLNSIAIIKKLAIGLSQKKDLVKLKTSLLAEIERKGNMVVKEWLISKLGV